MRSFALSVLLAIAPAAPSFAATLHNASVATTCDADMSSTTTTLATSTVSHSSSSGSTNCGAVAFTYSGGGTTRVSASIQNPGSDDNLTLDGGRAQASAWISYSFFLATSIEETGPVPFSVNLHSAGSVQASSNQLISDQGQFLNSGQVISSSLRAFGSLSANGQAQVFEERVSVRVSPGDSDGDALSGNFTTPTIFVEAGDLLSLSFGLSGSTGGQLFGAPADGRVSAQNSLSFATVGDVFNLADGYSVVIDEARIVNNRYTAPATEMLPVPLPAGGLLMLSALLGMAGFARRGRNNG